MWTCEKLHVKIFRSWLRVFSGETMAGRFYHRSFSENVLKVGSVFVWLVFNWFWSRESLVLRCGISRKKYQLKGVVNQHSKHLSFNPLTQTNKHYDLRSSSKWKDLHLSAKKASENNHSIVVSSQSTNAYWLSIYFLLSKKSPLNSVNFRL